MKDKNKTKEQLIKELVKLHQRIAELEKSELKRKHTEELYQTFTEKSFAGVYVVQDGMFQFLNPNAAAYAGYTQEELTGKPAISIVHPEDKKMVRENAVKMLNGESASPHKFRIVTKDGSIRWIMETVTSIHYKGKPAILGNSMDITGKVMAEEFLRESEQRLADIINFLPDATFAIDLDGRVTAWNHAIEEMTGVKAEDMLGKGNYEYALPFYGVRRPILIDLVFKSDEEIEKKYSFIRKEKNCLIVETDVPFVKGRNLHLWGKASPIFDHKGNVIGAIESIRDITERKRIEEAMKQSEEKYRTLIDSTLDIIFTVDRKGLFAYINPRFEKITGYPGSEIIGRPFTYIIAPELIESTINRFKKGIKGEAALPYETDLIHKNGKRIPVEFLVTTLYDPDGKPTGRFGIGRDITERRHAGEALRESEQRLKNVFEGYSIPTFVVGKDHRVMYWNRALEELSSIKAEEVIGTNEHWKAFYKKQRPCMADLLVDERPEEVPRWYEGKYSKSELIDEAYEATDFFPALGSEGKWLRITTALLRDSSGAIVGALETLEDVTERKWVEEELQKYSEQLEDMVEERTRELRDAQEQLVRKEKFAILGQLAGGVGHELRNPLGVISNAVYYLKMVLPDAEETIKNYLETISSEVDRSTEIISDLLDLSRTKPADRDRVEVSGLISQVLDRHSPPEEVEVSAEIASDLPPLFVDPRQIGQILDNLITNACQAMPDGGRLTVQAAGIQDKVHFVIADTGYGISSENMSKLFEPLFTTRARGIGLGLAVSKNLAEANGGSIKVESEEGKGTTFTVILPTKEMES